MVRFHKLENILWELKERGLSQEKSLSREKPPEQSYRSPTVKSGISTPSSPSWAKIKDFVTKKDKYTRIGEVCNVTKAPVTISTILTFQHHGTLSSTG